MRWCPRRPRRWLPPGHSCAPPPSLRPPGRLYGSYSNLLVRLRAGHPLAAGPESFDKQIHLAAQAEPEGCVEEGRGERGRRGRHAQRGYPGRVPDHADDADDQAHALGEPRWRLGLQLTRRPQARPDGEPVDEAVRRVPEPEHGPDTEDHRLEPEQPSAAGDQDDNQDEGRQRGVETLTPGIDAHE